MLGTIPSSESDGAPQMDDMVLIGKFDDIARTLRRLHETIDRPKRLVRLYGRDEDGRLYDRKEDLDVAAELAGTIPRVGDSIVSRWLTGTRSAEHAKEVAGRWEHRKVLEVEAVYYRPDKIDDEESDHPWVVLVVRERAMTEEEWALL